MRNATLLFLIKRSKGKITDICLAMKKKGFGAGRYNGAGGKVENNETIKKASIRETEEEIGVEVKQIEKVAKLSFTFPHNPSWSQIVHVYLGEKWEGNIKESEEMNPKWFKIKDIPYKEMWPDDIFWLPKVISGEKVIASFTFGEKDLILEKEVNTVNSLN